jgi:hypothetical protein
VRCTWRRSRGEAFSAGRDPPSRITRAIRTADDFHLTSDALHIRLRVRGSCPSGRRSSRRQPRSSCPPSTAMSSTAASSTYTSSWPCLGSTARWTDHVGSTPTSSTASSMRGARRRPAPPTKLQEWEDFYNFDRPARRLGWPSSLRATTPKDQGPCVIGPRHCTRMRLRIKFPDCPRCPHTLPVPS